MDPGKGTESVDTGEEIASEEATEGEEAVEAPVVPEVRRHKVKVDKEEFDVDEATLIRDYQLAKASYAKMQEAATMRQQAEEQIAQVRALAESTKQDPRALFKALGLDARAFAEALLTEELENELLSPDEKELRDLRAWKSKRDADETSRQTKEREKEAEALTQQAGAEIESEIVDALKSSGMKATPRTVARVAEMLLASLDGEGQRMKASDALQRLQPEYRADVAELLEAQDPETLEREYPSLYKKILNHAATKSSAVPAFERGIGQKKQASAPRAKTWDELMKD